MRPIEGEMVRGADQESANIGIKAKNKTVREGKVRGG